VIEHHGDGPIWAVLRLFECPVCTEWYGRQIAACRAETRAVERATDWAYRMGANTPANTTGGGAV